jgi:hypothetical protein
MNSDGGVMLLAKLDQRLALTGAAAQANTDPREPSSITHSIHDMLRQRMYGLVQGWRDLSGDTKHELLHVLRLTNLSAMQGAKWLLRLLRLHRKRILPLRQQTKRPLLWLAFA